MTTRDATLETEGVSHDDTQQQPAPGGNPHRDISPAVARRRQQMAEETGQEFPESYDHNPAASEPTGDGEAYEETPRDHGGDGRGQPFGDADAGAAGETGADEPLVTVKIDGEERQVPLSEVTAGYQRASAANQRFEQASHRLREAQERLQRAQELEQRLQQQGSATASQEATQPAQAGQGGGAGPGADDDGSAALARKLQYGTDDEVREAVREMTAGRGQQVDPAQITQQAIQQMRQQQAYEQTLNTIGEEFPEVFQDPHLTRIAADNVHAVRANQLQQLGYGTDRLRSPEEIARLYREEQGRGTVAGDIEVFRAAASHVRQWDSQRRGTPPPQQQQAQKPKAQGDGFEGRRRSKRAIQAPPQGAAGHRAGEGEQPPDLQESRRKGIAYIRQQRGQQRGR